MNISLYQEIKQTAIKYKMEELAKNNESLLLRLNDKLLYAIKVEALQRSTPEKRVTPQELVRAALAEKFLPA
jgi:predicted DNA binding CopG/RHH family protein